MSFINKLKGNRDALPKRPPIKSVTLAWLGGFLTIAIVALLNDAYSTTLILGSFGATCVLVFGFPDVPFSQPRNVVIGHTVSSLMGLVFLTIFGPEWWSMAMAVGTAIAVMMLTRTVHPPAGSNPVIVFLTLPGWEFILFPTLIGALIVTTVALLFNNVTRAGKYPKYW